MALNTSYAINIFPLQSLDGETAETGEGRSNERSQDYHEGKAHLQAATDRDLPSLCRTERAIVFRQRTGHNRLNHALFVNVRMVSQCTSCPIMCDPY